VARDLVMSCDCQSQSLPNISQNKNVRMYYGSGTVAYRTSKWRHTRSADYRAAGGHCCICRSERRADVMAAILKVWHHIKKSGSVNRWRTILPNLILIRFEMTEP